jgi:hypothetical protein
LKADRYVDDTSEHIDEIQMIKEAQVTFDQCRREYGDMFSFESDNDDDDTETCVQLDMKSLTSTNSNASKYIDVNRLCGSGPATNIFHEDLLAERDLPRENIDMYHKSSLRLCFEQTIGNWPKYFYKRHRMARHGLPMTYGDVHTKEIRHWLKEDEHECQQAVHIRHMLENMAEQTRFLSLDVTHPIVPIDLRCAISVPSETNEFYGQHSNKKSMRRKLTTKWKKSFKRTQKTLH